MESATNRALESRATRIAESAKDLGSEPITKMLSLLALCEKKYPGNKYFIRATMKKHGLIKFYRDYILEEFKRDNPNFPTVERYKQKESVTTRIAESRATHVAESITAQLPEFPRVKPIATVLDLDPQVTILDEHIKETKRDIDKFRCKIEESEKALQSLVFKRNARVRSLKNLRSLLLRPIT